MNKLKEAGLKVYEPKGQHLYNTYLIDVQKCPLEIINSLARKGIYVGNISACKNEEIMNKMSDLNETDDSMSGGNNKDFDKSIRITFSKSKELSDGVLNEIIKEIKKKSD